MKKKKVYFSWLPVMEFFGINGLGNNPVAQLIEAATNDLLIGPDWVSDCPLADPYDFAHSIRLPKTRRKIWRSAT